MGVCYWCYWGWPKPIRDIYDDCTKKLGDDSALISGPAHVVWADENWLCVQQCLDHFDELETDYPKKELAIVRESLERLLAVPDKFKSPPGDFDEDVHNPTDFPPPKHWECEHR